MEEKTLLVALLVGLAHAISGIAVFVEPLALNVTPLAPLHDGVAWAGYGGGVVGAVLFAAGLMAIIGSAFKCALPRAAHLALFVPQQILLLLMLYAILTALLTGSYPDGYIPRGGAWFILTDQIWAWTLGVSHSVFLAVYMMGGFNRGVARSS